MTGTEQATIGTEAASDPAASLVDLFEKHKRKVYQFAFQLTRNIDDAMDVTQEAFLRLHREWHRWRPSKDPASWLYTVVRNLSIDVLRKRNAIGECEPDTDLPDIRAFGPEQIAIQQELSAMVWAEIGSLPLPLREALVLRDWHGLSYGQIAEILGVPVSTVTWRIHDARTILRRRMGRFL